LNLGLRGPETSSKELLKSIGKGMLLAHKVSLMQKKEKELTEILG